MPPPAAPGHFVRSAPNFTHGALEPHRTGRFWSFVPPGTVAYHEHGTLMYLGLLNSHREAAMQNQTEPHFEVAIIGAGFSGLGMATQTANVHVPGLDRAQLDVVAVERARPPRRPAG